MAPTGSSVPLVPIRGCAAGLPTRQEACSATPRQGRAPRAGSGRACPRPVAAVASAQNVFGAGDEDAGATGPAPDQLVAGAGLAAVVVAGIELALIDPQLTVEEVQLLHAGVK